MSAFSRAVGADARPAPRVIELTPADFSDAWEAKPKDPIALGLRLRSENDARVASFEASKCSTIEEANRTLLDIYVARGICDPNDVTRPHPLFELAEDMVPHALTARAVKRVFDELEKLEVEQSLLYVEASDDDVAELWAALAGETFEGMSTLDEMKARRYLRFALELIRSAT